MMQEAEYGSRIALKDVQAIPVEGLRCCEGRGV